MAAFGIPWAFLRIVPAEKTHSVDVSCDGVAIPQSLKSKVAAQQTKVARPALLPSTVTATLHSESDASFTSVSAFSSSFSGRGVTRARPSSGSDSRLGAIGRCSRRHVEVPILASADSTGPSAFDTTEVFTDSRSESDQTLLISEGRDHTGITVNPPVYHATTIVFPTLAALEAADENPFDGPYYGRWGTPTTRAVEDMVAKLEGGYRSIATSSGVAAISSALIAYLQAGDHILVADTVYEPTRKICSGMLGRFGVDVTFFDPMIGGDIQSLIQANTKIVLLEAPGSLTFEIPDVAAIAAVAHEREVLVMLDNTWATPLFFRPFEHGVDISIHAATKYLGGHSDVMMGFIVTTTRAQFRRIKGDANRLGCCPGPDDCYLVLRGIRTLAARMRMHEENGLKLAKWLQGREEVERVLHPALEDFPTYHLWKRDFKGSSGLFGVVLKEKYAYEDLAEMLDNMKHFKLGYSWGGFESLALPTDPTSVRTATTWTERGLLFRVHAGLEDVRDLIVDLSLGLARLRESQERRFASIKTSAPLAQ